MLQTSKSPAQTQNECTHTASELGIYSKMLMDLDATLGTLECLADSDTPRLLASNLTEWVFMQILALNAKLQELKSNDCPTPRTA